MNVFCILIDTKVDIKLDNAARERDLLPFKDISRVYNMWVTVPISSFI
jgi:hypothetical protein